VILIDLQEKLAGQVLNSNACIIRCAWMLNLTQKLQIPYLVCEQYPSGLGHTTDILQPYCKKELCIEKVEFSSYANQDFVNSFEKLNKNHVLLMGIETHVCVLQTAFDLKRVGYHVFVIVDAVSSRFKLDHKYGLKRMERAGIHLVTAEMVFFEWLKEAGTPEFKTLSKTFFN